MVAPLLRKTLMFPWWWVPTTQLLGLWPWLEILYPFALVFLRYVAWLLACHKPKHLQVTQFLANPRGGLKQTWTRCRTWSLGRCFPCLKQTGDERIESWNGSLLNAMTSLATLCIVTMTSLRKKQQHYRFAGPMVPSPSLEPSSEVNSLAEEDPDSAIAGMPVIRHSAPGAGGSMLRTSRVKHQWGYVGAAEC